MTAALLIIVGAVLCFWGSRSIRVAVLAAGFGLGWLLGQIFGSSWTTALLVGLAAAAATLVLTLVFARFVLFVAGALVGAVLGARIFLLADSDASEWVLGLIFVPCVALLGGFLANRWRHPFLRWGTAIAGASLLLAGIGQIGSDSTRMLWRPDSTGGDVVFGVLWVLLTVLGHRVQGSQDEDGRRGR
ncbi:TM7S3/TM198-like domain-containing protein [Marmoricola sp. RAF53]|uniref:TM7S3/TM198-like domain-containing protein n=1 Tax=Marmoricola sp. RAF53 TaxID=3233059 RepID=UPI003F97B90D